MGGEGLFPLFFTTPFQVLFVLLPRRSSDLHHPHFLAPARKCFSFLQFFGFFGYEGEFVVAVGDAGFDGNALVWDKYTLEFNKGAREDN